MCDELLSIFISLCLWGCTFTHVRVCACTPVHMCVPACGLQKTVLDVIPQELAACFLTQGPIQLSGMTNDSRESSHCHFLSTNYTHKGVCWHFNMESGGGWTQSLTLPCTAKFCQLSHLLGPVRLLISYFEDLVFLCACYFWLHESIFP